MGYPKIRPLGRDLSFPRIIVVIDLTIISRSDVFADKDHVALKLSLVNVPGLNYLLR